MCAGRSSVSRLDDRAARGNLDILPSKQLPGLNPHGLSAHFLAQIRCSRRPLYSRDLVRAVTCADPVAACLAPYHGRTRLADTPSLLLDVVPTYEERAAACDELIKTFVFSTVKVCGARGTLQVYWQKFRPFPVVDELIKTLMFSTVKVRAVWLTKSCSVSHNPCLSLMSSSRQRFNTQCRVYCYSHWLQLTPTPLLRRPARRRP